MFHFSLLLEYKISLAFLSIKVKLFHISGFQHSHPEEASFSTPLKEIVAEFGFLPHHPK